jgi:hypothetical protein
MSRKFEFQMSEKTGKLLSCETKEHILDDKAKLTKEFVISWDASHLGPSSIFFQESIL